jgi:hypothetical protein
MMGKKMNRKDREEGRELKNFLFSSPIEELA